MPQIGRYTLETYQPGAILTDTATGETRYFQPGDEAAEICREWDALNDAVTALRRPTGQQGAKNAVADGLPFSILGEYFAA